MKNQENIKIYVFLREKQVFYFENQKIKHFCINELLYNYMGFYVNKAEEFESVIEDNIREGRTKIENDKYPVRKEGLGKAENVKR